MLILNKLPLWAPEGAGTGGDGGAGASAEGGGGGSSEGVGTSIPSGTDVPGPPSFDDLDTMFGNSATPLSDEQRTVQPPPPSVEAPVVPAKVDGGSPAPQPPPGQPVLPAQPSPEIVALQERLAAQEAQIQAFRATQQPPAPQQQQGWRSPYHAPDGRPGMGIAQGVIDKLRSEDPNEASMAYGAVLADHAAAIHQQVMGEVGQLLDRVVNQVLPQRQQHTEVAQRFHNDFYREYGKLDSPLFKPIVGQVAMELAREGRVTPEGLMTKPEVRKILAQASVERIKQYWPGGVPTRQAGTPPANGASHGSPRGGVAATAVNGEMNLADEIAEMMRLG
jgi:hypothetical protein